MFAPIIHFISIQNCPPAWQSSVCCFAKSFPLGAWVFEFIDGSIECSKQCDFFPSKKLITTKIVDKTLCMCAFPTPFSNRRWSFDVWDVFLPLLDVQTPLDTIRTHNGIYRWQHLDGLIHRINYSKSKKTHRHTHALRKQEREKEYMCVMCLTHV